MFEFHDLHEISKIECRLYLIIRLSILLEIGLINNVDTALTFLTSMR